MSKKYELTEETIIISIGRRQLYRIRALQDFGDVEAGELGGYIESENNLSHDGDAWVYGDARVYGDDAYLTIGPIGSRSDITTFFNTKDGEIFVSCGCFLGSIDDFKEKAKETHGKNKHATVYLMAAELAERQIERRKKEESL